MEYTNNMESSSSSNIADVLPMPASTAILPQESISIGDPNVKDGFVAIGLQSFYQSSTGRTVRLVKTSLFIVQRFCFEPLNVPEYCVLVLTCLYVWESIILPVSLHYLCTVYQYIK